MNLNKTLILWVLIATSFGAAPSTLALDHNNIDEGRPLSFDDAESLGYREQSFEFGTSLNFPSDRPVGGSFSLEYLYGFALNSHLSIGIEPRFGGKADTENTSFDVNNLEVSVFHNFNREYNNVPAFAIKGDVEFPTGRDASGLEFTLRGIASKTIGQYSRLHLNLDLTLKTDVESQERSVIPAVILGYSQPLGYPQRFDQTFLAQIAVRANEDVNAGAIVTPGIGLRQQVSLRGIFDIGLEGDIASGGGERSELRLRVGYSLSF